MWNFSSHTLLEVKKKQTKKTINSLGAYLTKYVSLQCRKWFCCYCWKTLTPKLQGQPSLTLM